MEESRSLDEERARIYELVKQTMGDNFGQPFVPFALYHRDLDRILVVTRDCSHTEIQVNDFLTLMEDNYPEEGEQKECGFVVECARGLCRISGLPYPGFEVKKLLDFIESQFPHHSSQAGIARGILGVLKSPEVELL